MAFVSIVVPIYNVEKYLNECLESIAQQTFQDIQVILVDDGSTDRSPAMCDRFMEAMHHRFQVIVVRQENSGLSAARNRGIKEATGQFIVFLDSDDYINSALVEKCVNECIAHQYDIVFYKYERFDNTKRCLSDRFPNYQSGSSREVLSSIYSHNLDNFAWSFMARTALYSGVKFPVARNYEDRATTYRLVGKASSIGFIPEPLYHYRVRRGSITKSFGLNEAQSEIITYNEQQAWIRGRYPDLVTMQQRYCAQEFMNDFGDTVRADSFKANKASRRLLVLKIHEIISCTGIKGYPLKFLVKYYLMRFRMLHALQIVKSNFDTSRGK
ncbi:glycosyltransferase family 2 protein [Bifidobacterium mongoliense]|uniref:glycosyltransferase family 2 protein n=1 Tax=Bifidobacterium mongoliense TaxID=518643 RepID=UPI0030EE07BA